MKSNQKLTVLFWHRKSKADAIGMAPIICRISIDGSDAEFSIGKKVSSEHWDTEAKKAKGGSEARSINKRIIQISADLERHFTVLQMEHSHISPIMLRNVFNGLPFDHRKGMINRAVQQSSTILTLTDGFIKDFEQMVDRGLRSGETLRQWRSTRNKILEFVLYAFGKNDLDLHDIDYSFAARFYRYLTVERGKALQEAAAKKQIKNTKQILSIAESDGMISKNPIQKFRCGGDETDIQPLEFQQVCLLWQKRLPIKRLEEVRDVFVFQCFTGFAFQDVHALTDSHVVKVGLNGEKWLIKERGKTGVPEMVPVMPIIEQLIEKYRHHECRIVLGRLLPVSSNARYNGYLKEIGVLCGLDRELNTHLARHTFADMMLNVFGFSLEEVSKMLGHKTIRTTQRYAKVKKNKISQTWERVRSHVFTEDGQLKQIG